MFWDRSIPDAKRHSIGSETDRAAKTGSRPAVSRSVIGREPDNMTERLVQYRLSAALVPILVRLARSTANGGLFMPLFDRLHSLECVHNFPNRVWGRRTRLCR